MTKALQVCQCPWLKYMNEKKAMMDFCICPTQVKVFKFIFKKKLKLIKICFHLYSRNVRKLIQKKTNFNCKFNFVANLLIEANCVTKNFIF